MKNNKHIVKTTNVLYHKGGSDKELHFYESKSGKNLILEYIDSLSVNEQIDGYSVLQCLEEGRMDEIIYIYCMPAENRKIKQKNETKRLWRKEQKNWKEN